MPPLDGVELVRVADGEAASRVAAERLARAAAAGSAIVLSGGSTPRRAFELAAELGSDWSGASVWWGDERCVPPDDERSNFRLACESLLARLEREPGAVHRIRGELGAEAAADAYDDELRGVRLGLALLGLGADGHTASLFPGAPSLGERDRLAVAAEPGLAPWVERVTLTVPALSAAGEIVFLAVGSDKADAVERAFARSPGPETPASLVRSRHGETTLIADRAAAAKLDS